MIVIIDYDMGNVGAIKNMLHRIGYDDVKITRDKDDICEAEKLILPGVGAFDSGMLNLRKYDLINIIKEEVIEKKKDILGICLGMQILGLNSEEGLEEGLSLIPFENVRFDLPDEFKIPHMGWSEVEIVNDKHKLVKGLLNDVQRYYFVHSFHAKCISQYILMQCDYGYKFTAAVASGNIMGVQFHPEKSHFFGMKILENFVRI